MVVADAGAEDAEDAGATDEADELAAAVAVNQTGTVSKPVKKKQGLTSREEGGLDEEG